MPDLVLTRVSGDRRRYAIEGVGTLQLTGWFARDATAEAGGREWRFSRRGLLRARIDATDGVGGRAGEFVAEGLRRGGAVRWGERELSLRPASAWRERYALAEGERELALLDAKGWGKRPVRITVADMAAVEPPLLLFAAFVVHGLAEDASGAATAGATTAATAAGS
jgi:hypothetical protein